MRLGRINVALVLIASVPVIAQQGSSGLASLYWSSKIVHNGTTDTVSTSFPRPLLSAIEAFNREYGLMVDYEEPVYDEVLESSEVSNPYYEQKFPGKHARIPSGGSFTATYANVPIEGATEWKKSAITTIISSYNASSNPGTFEMSTDSDGRINVKGKSRNGRPSVSPLSVSVTLPVGSVSGAVALTELLNAINTQSNVHVVNGKMPVGQLLNETVTFDGTTMDARQVLRQIADGTPVRLVWELQYDFDSQLFYLSLLPRTIRVGSDPNNPVFRPVPTR
jgi:hypothetical protein